jgi:16S rRNA (cytidine1402-2'-O)-methyltransferase
MSKGLVYLIPTVLAEDGLAAIPAYILDAVKVCSVFFVEEERTARRYLKKLWREMVIDDYKWYVIDKKDPQVKKAMEDSLRLGLTVGIMSEAGCPGVADPGQDLVAFAQGRGATVKPLVGPNSILLALMASGMNGQHFRFKGYLPVDQIQRNKVIKELEAESSKTGCTQIFIETPYRNNQMLESLLKICQPATRLCIGREITAVTESIQTKTISDWKKEIPELHKRPAIFLLSV